MRTEVGMNSGSGGWYGLEKALGAETPGHLAPPGLSPQPVDSLAYSHLRRRVCCSLTWNVFPVLSLDPVNSFQVLDPPKSEEARPG